jgi:hypothetical protein
MCVEVARLPQAIGIRDGKNPAGPYLSLPARSFAALINRVKASEL